MRKRILRQLEVLEKEHRSREQREQSSLDEALGYIWRIVLAYHLGDLKSDEKDPWEAEARALKYPSSDDYSKALVEAILSKDIKDISAISEQYNDAHRRLFAKVGLDFDDTPRSVLYRVPEIVTRGRFPDGGESDSTWRTQEARHVGSDTIAPGF
jgi:hypothetical protein